MDYSLLDQTSFILYIWQYKLSLIICQYINDIFLALLFIFYHTLGRKMESKQAIRTETEYFLLMRAQLELSTQTRLKNRLRQCSESSSYARINCKIIQCFCVHCLFFSSISPTQYVKNKLLGSRTAYAGRLSFRLSRKL